MKLLLNLQLPGFQDFLQTQLPKGVLLHAIQIEDDKLCLNAQAPMLGQIQLQAAVRPLENGLCFHQFQLQGAGLASGLILNQLREKISNLDLRRGQLRFWGDSDGSSAYLSWAL